MLKSYWQSLFADPDGAPALVRRLLMQQAAGQWRRYALAFGLMGIAAASQALNLLITAFGRDLLSLVGLLAVMAVQDPVLSALSIIVVPPAMLILRKMIRRIKTIAHHQFTGSARILETLQETLQGMRTLKAFNLEDAMRARFDMHVAE